MIARRLLLELASTAWEAGPANPQVLVVTYRWPLG